jgi:Mrp family chromosome partitioning ATPase
MSKNFQLLQQMNKEREVVQPLSARLVPVERKGRNKHARLDDLAREEVVRLVQHLFFTPQAQSPRVVVFSGVQHGDGCSRICAHAAATVASRARGAVCVVDANLTRPSLHRYFGVENPFGLRQMLVDSAPIRSLTQQIGDHNLWLLSAGSPLDGESARAASDKLRARMDDLRREFEYVLIDTPPVNLYADCIALGHVSDGIVLVLGSNSTRREAARRAKENLSAAKVRVLGAVLNKRTFPIPDILYRRL